MEVDLANEKTIPLAPGPALQPSGITFDTKRGRLLITASDFLYAYEPKDQKWSRLGALRDGEYQTASLTYHPELDALFVLSSAHPPNLSLHRYDDAGQLVEKIPLGEPLTQRVVNRLFTFTFGLDDGAVQMIATGDFLVVLVTERPVQARAKTERYIFLVDPKTGQVRLTSRSEL